MVAVKTLWVLWKSFSTNFSFSNSNGASSSENKNEKEYKRVKYNRLRGQVEKSESCFFPKSTNMSLNTIPKSHSAVESSNNFSSSAWSSPLEDSESEVEDNRNEQTFTFNEGHVEDFSDLDDEDEALTCDVCDRSFPTAKKLNDHQQKKRHFGCLQCDSIFPSHQSLLHHRQEMDHYDFESDYDSDTTSFESDEEGIEDNEEERERLL